jgi:hypothetical protein
MQFVHYCDVVEARNMYPTRAPSSRTSHTERVLPPSMLALLCLASNEQVTAFVAQLDNFIIENLGTYGPGFLLFAALNVIDAAFSLQKFEATQDLQLGRHNWVVKRDDLLRYLDVRLGTKLNLTTTTLRSAWQTTRVPWAQVKQKIDTFHIPFILFFDENWRQVFIFLNDVTLETVGLNQDMPEKARVFVREMGLDHMLRMMDECRLL